MRISQINVPLNQLTRLVSKLRYIPGAHEVADQLDKQVAHLSRLLTPEQTGLQQMLDPLTPREQAILRLVAKGLSNRQVAAHVSLTEGTIKQYMSSILSKLAANDRTHAVVIATENRLI